MLYPKKICECCWFSTYEETRGEKETLSESLFVFLSRSLYVSNYPRTCELNVGSALFFSLYDVLVMTTEWWWRQMFAFTWVATTSEWVNMWKRGFLLQQWASADVGSFVDGRKRSVRLLSTHTHSLTYSETRGPRHDDGQHRTHSVKAKFSELTSKNSLSLSVPFLSFDTHTHTMFVYLAATARRRWRSSLYLSPS